MDLDKFTQMYDLKHRTAVVTGGAGILGGEIACALAGCGANVAIVDLVPQLDGYITERLPASLGRSIAIYGDVLDPASLSEAAKTVLTEFGSIDILVNGAGGNNSKATTSPILSFFNLPVEALQSVFNLNLLGTVISCQIFGRFMAERGEGAILNISSMNSFRPLTHVPAYSAAKAGVSNFTQWLAVHLAREYSPGIRVNAIAPGFFLTNQNKYLLIDEQSGGLTPRGRAIIEHTPLGRFGEAKDLLGTVLWLLSPASAFVTGAVIPVDGGFSAFSGV